MKVFVTGIAGFLGSHLAEALRDAGHEVAGCDNLIGGDLDNVPAGVEFHRLDCRNLPALKLLFRGVDLAYHAAATAHEGLSVFSPAENAEHGYAATASVVSAAAAAGVRRLVYMSSMARYGENLIPFTEDMVPAPQDPYGIGKVAGEDLVLLMGKVHGYEPVVVVPHNIIGPRQRFVDAHRNVASIMINLMLQGRQPIIYGDGNQSRCFSFISDVVEPLKKLGTQDNVVGKVINIGPDDEFITINELAQRIARIIGFDLKPLHVPDRPQEVRLATCSADKARCLLDYEPKVKLDDGLRQMVDWIRKIGPRPFEYRLDLEIVNNKTPTTWRDRMF